LEGQSEIVFIINRLAELKAMQLCNSYTLCYLGAVAVQNVSHNLAEVQQFVQIR